MQEKIIIVDSSSVVHRNYHGYPAKYSTVNESQININTLYGYINYIHKVSQEFEFDHLIHVLRFVRMIRLRTIVLGTQ